MIGLADCNNFFVSCERSVNPSLIDKAVVVLSNNDGCVVSRSNESKRLGVRMGQPAFEIKKLISNGQVIALSGNHLLYRDISLRVHDLFRKYVPSTLDYSVDESFLDVAGIPVNQLQAIGYAIYEECLTRMRIPVTIGFAPTKTLAKIVTDYSKKGGNPVGIVKSVSEAWPLLQKSSVGDIWGIGRRIAKRLYQNGIYTMADFASKNVNWIRRNLGVNGERSWRELNGEACITLDHIDRPLQDSISETRTFPEDVDDYDYLRARIVIYASDCARKLRAMKGVCNGVGVFLRGNPFHAERASIRPSLEMQLKRPSCLTPEITKAAIGLLDAIYTPGAAYKRGGVWLSGIVKDIPDTPSLFDPPDERTYASRRLMKVVDLINGGVGNPRLTLASQLVQVQRGHNDGYSSSFQAPKR